MVSNLGSYQEYITILGWMHLLSTDQYRHKFFLGACTDLSVDRPRDLMPKIHANAIDSARAPPARQVWEKEGWDPLSLFPQPLLNIRTKNQKYCPKTKDWSTKKYENEPKSQLQLVDTTPNSRQTESNPKNLRYFFCRALENWKKTTSFGSIWHSGSLRDKKFRWFTVNGQDSLIDLIPAVVRRKSTVSWVLGW